ncbi:MULTISPECIES: CE1759 family FMN reductase [unclassified Streptomyces]|uniref:CE1759 family FMN reductase n=1 Tax=unclassified Streptomyces TaxID=2593676 RepID=UPI0004BDA2B6|nr:MULTISPECIES: CE1759 family FMN reductase [unclassified Streptomyces]
MKLVVVSAGLSTPSATRLLADRLTAATLDHLDHLDHLDAEPEVVELRELATEIARHLVTGFPPARLAAALDAVAAADGLIAVTPVFAASYSGLFKSFFDLLDKDALTGTPVLVAATGGTARHGLVTEHAMRPLFTHVRAPVVPTAVYAASEDWGEQGLARRITRAGTELARSVAATAATAATASTDSVDPLRPAAGTTAPDLDTAAATAPRSPTGAITSTDPTNGLTTMPFAQRLAALQAG